jgi:hypothetical protein
LSFQFSVIVGAPLAQFISAVFVQSREQMADEDELNKVGFYFNFIHNCSYN